MPSVITSTILLAKLSGKWHCLDHSKKKEDECVSATSTETAEHTVKLQIFKCPVFRILWRLLVSSALDSPSPTVAATSTNSLNEASGGWGSGSRASSTSRRVSGLIPNPSSSHVDVSLGTILNPNLYIWMVIAPDEHVELGECWLDKKGTIRVRTTILVLVLSILGHRRNMAGSGGKGQACMLWRGLEIIMIYLQIPTKAQLEKCPIFATKISSHPSIHVET